MADMRVLLTGLEEYQESLTHHINQVRDDFQMMENRWHALNSVYEGTAADDFRHHWMRTVESFQEYINQTQQISIILQERIEALREADQAGNL